MLSPQSPVLTTRPPRIGWTKRIWFKYYSENPTPKKKLTINPNQYGQCLTLISIVSA